MPQNNAVRPTTLVTAAVLVIALAAAFFVGRTFESDDDAAVPAAAGTEPFGVVTGGEAAITGIPDQLTFSASVSNTRGTTAAALRATSADVRAITAAARRTGVASHDVQTREVSLQPKYRYLRSGGSRLVGYSSTQSVKIKVRKLADAGETIGAVATAAGNDASIKGITLSISNRDELVSKARASAVMKSRAAALAMARAAGRDLGDLEYVEEVVPQQTYNETAGFSTDALNFRGAVPTVPISPGKQQVSVTVKVRWALADQ